MLGDFIKINNPILQTNTTKKAFNIGPTRTVSSELLTQIRLIDNIITNMQTPKRRIAVNENRLLNFHNLILARIYYYKV